MYVLHSIFAWTYNLFSPSLFHQGSLHSAAYFNDVAPSSAAAMTFGDYPFLAPPIQGEFTSLLLQAHGHNTTPSTSRRLNFSEGTSTPRFDGSHMF
jgi:hypothetical protein